MTVEKTAMPLCASLLSEGLEDYCNLVALFLAMESLDDYCMKACAYYKQRGIPASIAALNLRRALSSNV